MTSVLFGLLMGTLAGDQSSAVQAVSTIGFLTALLLSGFIYPLSNIPFPYPPYLYYSGSLLYRT
jgi:ABC-2 type transport system permease protein